MSSFFDLLANQLGGSTPETIGRQLGIDSQQARTAIAAAIPTLVEAMNRQAADPAAAGKLHQALQDHDGSILDNLPGYLERGEGGPHAAGGEQILDHLLGTKRGRVESGISGLAGLNAQQASKLMAMLAPLVMGMLARQSRQQKLDPGQLTDYLRREKQSMEQGDGAQASLIGKFLDQDGDGDFDAQDLLRLGASIVGRMFK